MSDHDILMSEFMKLIRQLEQYLEEYAPIGGTQAIEHLKKAAVLATHFPDHEVLP